MNKLYPGACVALDGFLADGQTPAVGGFGLCGIPESSIEAINQNGSPNRVVFNNAAVDGFGLGALQAAPATCASPRSHVAGSKVPFDVNRIAASQGVPVIARVRTLGEGSEKLYKNGIGAALSWTPGAMTLATAVGDAASLPQLLARDIALLISATGRQSN